MVNKACKLCATKKFFGAHGRSVFLVLARKAKVCHIQQSQYNHTSQILFTVMRTWNSRGQNQENWCSHTFTHIRMVAARLHHLHGHLVRLLPPMPVPPLDARCQCCVQSGSFALRCECSHQLVVQTCHRICPSYINPRSKSASKTYGANTRSNLEKILIRICLAVEKEKSERELLSIFASVVLPGIGGPMSRFGCCAVGGICDTI